MRENVLVAKFFQKEYEQILGPVFLIATLGLAGTTPLLFIGGFLGLYFAARLQKFWALLSVVMVSALQQCLLTEHHLWFFGLELSLACSLFITALNFEKDTEELNALSTQAEAHAASIQNLEEELSLEKENAQAQQIALQNKTDSLQKELEDLQLEQSSLQVLNEVLRKTAVRHTEEKATLEEKSLNQQRRIASLQTDLLAVEKELERFSHPDSLAEQNRHLLTELNAARYQREQTQLINETLVRLHAKETLKAKEAIALQHMLEQTLAEKDALRSELQHLTTSLEEKRFLEERLTQSAAERDALRSELQKLEEKRSEHLSEIESLRAQVTAAPKTIAKDESAPLLAQLRLQFEEKNKVLAETRAALFRADTELQALRIEKEQLLLQIGEIPQEIQSDLERLEEESAHLEEIVNLLSLKKK
jgi:DNA repair exonuclease SbcCD ATPase subunit